MVDTHNRSVFKETEEEVAHVEQIAQNWGSVTIWQIVLIFPRSIRWGSWRWQFAVWSGPVRPRLSAPKKTLASALITLGLGGVALWKDWLIGLPFDQSGPFWLGRNHCATAAGCPRRQPWKKIKGQIYGALSRAAASWIMTRYGSLEDLAELNRNFMFTRREKKEEQRWRLNRALTKSQKAHSDWST